MLTPSVILLSYLILLLPGVITAQQAYCWEDCRVNCPLAGPRLCPPEGIMTYYDCCVEGCCEYIKWPNLIFLLCIILALLAGCGCCCFFLITDAQRRYKDNGDAPRSRRWKKSQRRKSERELQIATVEGTPIPPPRYYEQRRTTVV